VKGASPSVTAKCHFESGNFFPIGYNAKPTDDPTTAGFFAIVPRHGPRACACVRASAAGGRVHTRTPTPLALCSGDDFKKKKVTDWGGAFQVAIDQRLLAVPPACEAAFKKLCALTHRLRVHARVRDCVRVRRLSARARVRVC
jgi:hypothetical protein